METTIIVKIIKPFEVYCKGDIAGFSDEVAKKLLEQKIAVPYNGEDDHLRGANTADPAISPDWQKRVPDLGLVDVLICPICGFQPESFELLCKHKKENHGIE